MRIDVRIPQCQLFKNMRLIILNKFQRDVIFPSDLFGTVQQSIVFYSLVYRLMIILNGYVCKISIKQSISAVSYTHLDVYKRQAHFTSNSHVCGKKEHHCNGPETLEQIKVRSLSELKVIPKLEFHKRFIDWKECWHNCIVYDGNYFEGANINFEE